MKNRSQDIWTFNVRISILVKTKGMITVSLKLNTLTGMSMYLVLRRIDEYSVFLKCTPYYNANKFNIYCVYSSTFTGVDKEFTEIISIISKKSELKISTILYKIHIILLFLYYY